jgi:hypothetical protein
LPGAIHDQELVFEEKRLRNDGTDAARTEQPSQDGNEMDEKNGQIAHRRMVAGRGILRNLGRNNNSPATGKEFGTKGHVPIKATFNGVPYTGSLVKYRDPLHMLGVSKTIREQIGKGPGDTIEVIVWRDEEVRTVEVPAQFENLLKKEGLLPVFEKLSYTHRKEYCRWITDAKKEETRLKRLGKAIEMLKKGISTPG